MRPCARCIGHIADEEAGIAEVRLQPNGATDRTLHPHAAPLRPNPELRWPLHIIHWFAKLVPATVARFDGKRVGALGEGARVFASSWTRKLDASIASTRI